MGVSVLYPADLYYLLLALVAAGAITLCVSRTCFGVGRAPEGNDPARWLATR